MLEIEQDIEALELIINTYTSKLTTSKLLKQSIEYAQLEVGVEESVFLSDFKKYRALATEGWIKLVWYFYDFYRLQLNFPTTYYPKSPILNDKIIISIAVEYQLFNQKSI